MTCERRVSREALTLVPKSDGTRVGVWVTVVGWDLIFYKQESMHTHSIKHLCVSGA